LKIHLLFASVVAFLAVFGSATVVGAQPQAFVAHLSASHEVQTPAIDSNAQGQAIFQLSADGSALGYELIVANISDVQAAHIHLAPAGTNGPVVAFLFHGPATSGRTQGVLAQGTITAADLIGPLAGHPLSDLVSAMRAGGTYTNVHTSAHPAGEIRGQIH
jgi:hypothetical protein